jgi:putative lipoic acid-binding regulatory protein
MDNRAEFYEKLKNKLDEGNIFPSEYLFKFIVSTHEEKIKQVEDLFDFKGAVITKTSSKTGKFTSISIHVIMKNSEDIISIYLKAEKIEGIISL